MHLVEICSPFRYFFVATAGESYWILANRERRASQDAFAVPGLLLERHPRAPVPRAYSKCMRRMDF